MRCCRLPLLLAVAFAWRPWRLGVSFSCLLVIACLACAANSCPAQTLSLGPTTRGAIRPDTVPAEQLKKIIAGIGDDDAEVRHAARVQVKNLPAGAYEAIRSRYNPDDLDPETAAALEGAMKTLVVRYRQFQRLAADLEWQKRQALEAYEHSGEHDPSWGPAAREALASLGERLYPEEGSETAAKVAVFKKAADAGCTDPLVWTFYTHYQLDHHKSEAGPLQGVAGPTEGEPNTAEKTPKAGEAGKGVPELEPGTAEHMRAAAEAMKRGGYPARFECMAFQGFARLLIETGGDRAEAKRYLDASLGLLPEALKTPGYPVDRQVGLMFTQFRSSARLDPSRDAEQAFKRLRALYDAVAGDARGPLLFKAKAYAYMAWAGRGNGPADELPEKKLTEFAERLGLAREALEAAWKLDPADGRVPVELIAVEAERGFNREEIEAWFKRAMEADPDNYAACEKKMLSLSPASGHGSEADMLEFGRQCLDTENFRGRVAFMLVQAHLALAQQAGNPPDYFRRPNVWKDVRETYEGCLKVFPDSAYDRSTYAKLAYAAGEYEEADRQFAALGEKGDTDVWGGQESYDFFRLEAARKVQALGKGRAADPVPAVDPAFARALQEAAEGGEGARDFQTALRSVAARFTEAKVCAEHGKAVWNKVTLNGAGKGIDCIRFRTPGGKPTDMRWAFVMGKNRLASWYIMRVDKADMNGFTEFNPFEPQTLNNLQGPGDGGAHSANVQQLPAASLRPDTEYLIWFRFRDREPVRTSVAITFVPPAAKPADWRAILKDMGMKWAGD